MPDTVTIPDDKTAHDTTFGVLIELGMERSEQDEKWGQQNHNDGYWALILGEEFGEACQAALHATGDSGRMTPRGFAHLREELVQTAAVAVSWIEAIDRR